MYRKQPKVWFLPLLGLTGTETDKKRQKGQTGKNRDRQIQMGTDRDIWGHAGTERDCPCLSLKKSEIKQEQSQQIQNRDKTRTRRDNSAEKNRDKPSRDQTGTMKHIQGLFSLDLAMKVAVFPCLSLYCPCRPFLSRCLCFVPDCTCFVPACPYCLWFVPAVPVLSLLVPVLSLLDPVLSLLVPVLSLLIPILSLVIRGITGLLPFFFKLMYFLKA